MLYCVLCLCSCVPIATQQRGTIAGFAVLCVAGACTWCTFGPAWSWPAEIFHGPARASGIALFNSCGAAGTDAPHYCLPK